MPMQKLTIEETRAAYDAACRAATDAARRSGRPQYVVTWIDGRVTVEESAPDGMARLLCRRLTAIGEDGARRLTTPWLHGVYGR